MSGARRSPGSDPKSAASDATLVRVGVTGTVVEDTIDTVDGLRIEDLGGISYALHGLSAFLAPDSTAHAVLGVGRDAFERVRDELGELPGIDLGGLEPVRHVNNKVHLEYHKDGTRDETLTGGVPPLSWEFLEPWLERLDVWLWNFISGMETELDTFTRLKREFDGAVYMDIHSLCLEHVPGRARRHRRPERWEEWVEGVRWLQMNETEAGLLQRDRPRTLPPGEEARLAARLHGLGVEGVLFTLGARGARWYGADGTRLTEPVPEGEPAVDPTGCGDVFGATWIMLHAAHGRTPVEALTGAVEAASLAASRPGTRGLADHLREGTGVEA
ncbi:MAG: PfkB family carbohydrate kinase [Gemmatimonadota bacterium]